MDGLVDSVEYYYDEDFSVPFDVGIGEENNNAGGHAGLSGCPYARYDGGSDEEYGCDDGLDGLVRPVDIFVHCPTHKLSSLGRRVSDGDPPSRMSCSSSSSPPTSADLHLLNDSFTARNVSFTDSAYSLRHRLPLFSCNVLANYHLHFAPPDSPSCQSMAPDDDDDRQSTDSGQGSAATVDSLLHRHIQPIHHNMPPLRPSAVLWRQLKQLMGQSDGWGLVRLLRRARMAGATRCRSTDDICRRRTVPSGRQRFSCTILELYNVLERPVPVQTVPDTNGSTQHFSCQFPPLRKDGQQPTTAASDRRGPHGQPFDYPGIGRICMPKPMRLKSSAFLANDLQSQLTFLQSSFDENLSAVRRDRSRLLQQSPLNNNCNNQNNHNHQSASDTVDTGVLLKPCLRREDDFREAKEILRGEKMDGSGKENFKRKSVSFDCPRLSTENLLQELREIPKKWGLLGQTETKPSADMMAVFECGIRDISPIKPKSMFEHCSVNEDAARLRDMVNEVLRAVKQISERLALGTVGCDNKPSPNGSGSDPSGSFQSQLSSLCEMICMGTGLDTPLATAIDNLIALLADGLVVTSFSNKKVRLSASAASKASMRLWLLVEETCRGASGSNVSLKSELGQLLKDVRQLIANSPNSSKDHQLRLRTFIASALRVGLLHVWLRTVVANETALQRFYCPEAFLRQARSGQSDALAALTVSLKALVSAQSSPGPRPPVPPHQPVISKPVVPPPVRISRRYLVGGAVNSAERTPVTIGSSSTSAGKSQLHRPPMYSDDNTESESFADESRSSQSECPPAARDASNNNTVPRGSYSRSAVRKSLSSALQPSSVESGLRNSPLKKPPLKPPQSKAPSVLLIQPLKTVRTQPLTAPRMVAPPPPVSEKSS